MRLRLPEPLPFDYVDELLDETYIFQSVEEEDGLVYCRASYRDTFRPTGNYSRLLFSLMDDSIESEEDEEGYIDYPYTHDGMVWTARELTEDEIDEILGDMHL